MESRASSLINSIEDFSFRREQLLAALELSTAISAEYANMADRYDANVSSELKRALINKEITDLDSGISFKQRSEMGKQFCKDLEFANLDINRELERVKAKIEQDTAALAEIDREKDFRDLVKRVQEDPTPELCDELKAMGKVQKRDPAYVGSTIEAAVTNQRRISNRDK
jgi:hypothetical protein